MIRLTTVSMRVCMCVRMIRISQVDCSILYVLVHFWMISIPYKLNRELNESEVYIFNGIFMGRTYLRHKHVSKMQLAFAHSHRDDYGNRL